MGNGTRELFITTKLQKEDKLRVQKDLLFIDLLTRAGKALSVRVIIHGGYAVDGNLGQITRPHNDIDIQVYGPKPDTIAVMHDLEDMAKVMDNRFMLGEIEDKGRQEYYHNLFIRREDSSGVDLYYMHTASDPFGLDKIIVKADGSVGDPQKFDNTVKVTIEGITFEATNATQELGDKLYKRDNRGDAKLEKHNQDITNLRLITNKEEVDSLVKRLANRKK